MKTTTARSLRCLPPLLLAWGLSSVSLLAQTNQTITGNLSVVGLSDFGGNPDFNGNSLSFGSRNAPLSTTPGAIWTYIDGTTPQITWSATQTGLTWLWHSGTSPQFRVDGTNTLGLFVPGATTPAIILNPAGLSTFAQGLTVTGVLTASGGLSSPGGTVTGGTNGLTLSAGGTDKNITITPSGNGWTTTAAPFRVTSGTSSSSKTTGALIVTGGVGVGGTVNANVLTSTGSVTGASLKATGTTASTSSSTGALTVAGGVGVAGELTVGGASSSTARLTVSGTSNTNAASAANFTDSTGKSLLLVRNDGNVGIGTSTPTAKLEVVGDAKVSGTLTVGTPTSGTLIVGGQSVVTANQLSNYATMAQVAPYAKPTALFNNAGTAIATVGTDGKINFASGLTAGPDASASGTFATALGRNATATGYGSNAMGAWTTASGPYSTAIGNSTTASELYSTAMGVSTIANGGYSTAMGIGTIASGGSSTAMGAGTIASGGYSTAMGYSTTASGYYSTATGFRTAANAYGSTVIGLLNVIRPENSATAWVATDDLFVIGNGIFQQVYDEDTGITTDFSIRSNAFSVKKNGDTMVSGTTTLTGAVIAQNNITVRNRKVIRVNAAGDIPMIGYNQPGDEPEVLLP